MIARGWRSKLPRLLIAGMAFVAAVAIVSEIESKRDVGGAPVNDEPVPIIESRTWVVGQDPMDVIFDGEKLCAAVYRMNVPATSTRRSPARLWRRCCP